MAEIAAKWNVDRTIFACHDAVREGPTARVLRR